MPPILCSRWHPRAHKIWIDNALGAAARCRCVALRQGGIAAFVIVTPSPRVHVQANRISRIEGLGPSRRRRQNRRDRQKRQSLNAHQNSFSGWDQMGVRWFKVNSRSRAARPTSGHRTIARSVHPRSAPSRGQRSIVSSSRIVIALKACVGVALSGPRGPNVAAPAERGPRPLVKTPPCHPHAVCRLVGTIMADQI
jgi:hypothetical protein